MAVINSLPVSTSLRTEVNAVGEPDRQKAQDGTRGDTAHAQRDSDHNADESGNTGSSSDTDNIDEVHARDVDARGPWKIKGGAERIVQLIVANTRAKGYAKRRVKYVIFKGRIWVWRKISNVWQFVQEKYTGADPHTEHFHVSFMYGSGSGASNPENDTSPWGILAAYQAEQEEHVDAKDAKLFVDTMLDTVLPFPYDTARPTRTIRDLLRYIPSAGTVAGYVDGQLAPRFATLQVAVNNLAEKAGQPVDLSDEDTAAIVSGLLAGLPADLAQKIAKAGVDEAAKRLNGEAE